MLNDVITQVNLNSYKAWEGGGTPAHKSRTFSTWLIGLSMPSPTCLETQTDSSGWLGEGSPVRINLSLKWQ